MITLYEENMLVRLTVDDARTAQDAGTQFARGLASTEAMDFLIALAEQEEMIHCAIIEAGYTVRQAQLAAGRFEAAARAEWQGADCKPRGRSAPA